MDIIVTTPKSEMKNSAQEAADCIAAGGGQYFRKFRSWPCHIKSGERVYYVEDGYLRGFAIVDRVELGSKLCETTGRDWGKGFYVFMNADSWRWIKPIPMKGFQGYRRAIGLSGVHVIGDWKQQKPLIE